MRRELVILMVLLSIFLAIGCAGKGKIVDVRIQNYAYYPDSITVSPGDTIKWTNLDSDAHTVLGIDFSSGNISYEQSYEHTFTKAGTYNYYCSIDPSMKGIIIVK
jgi:plastocyanin